MSKNNTGVASNFLWKFAERISAQVVTLVVSIVLARLLEPSHYGIISMVMVFITIANILVSDGFGSALIQKKDADSLDFSSVLVASVFLAIVLYLVLFFSAPYISKFYGEEYELLTPVLRVLGLRLILSAINSVQQAYVSRQMIFKKFFWATLFGTAVSAVVGIALAYKGFGVWALVAQYLTNTTIDTIILQCSLRKWPGLNVSLKRLKSLFSYGFKILIASLINNGYQSVKSLVIGKLYTSSDLAFYHKGEQFPSIAVNNINVSISAVMFSKMSKLQDNLEGLKAIVRRAIRVTTYLLTPFMCGLFATAPNFISFLLTDKWLPCVPFIQMFCIFYLVQPIHTLNIQAIKATGKSGTYLVIEIIRKGSELIALLLVMRISVLAIAVSSAVLNILLMFVASFPNNKFLNYTIFEQLKDLSTPVIMGVIMAVCVFFVGKLPLPVFYTLVLQVLTGVAIYVLLSVITKNKEFHFVLDYIKGFFKKKSVSEKTGE